jgi:threonine dehydratase
VTSRLTPDLTAAHIERAADAIGRHVRVTPIIQVPAGDVTDQPGLADTTLVLKLEHLQHSGSFKARGAANFMATQPIGPGGVVAASGGNHGAAVAWAASEFGHAANIFVPTIAARAKIDRLRAHGATVHQGGDVFSEAHAASLAWQEVNDAAAIHPYDDPTVMCGAATCSREFERQAGLLDAVLVACGGGGLAGGAASWFTHRVEVVACETEGTATFATARRLGLPTDITVSGLAADALGATRLGAHPWQALHAAEASSIVVTDDQLDEARRRLWDRLRLMVEPAAAAPIAALITGQWRPRSTVSHRIGVVLCGANTDPGTVSS